MEPARRDGRRRRGLLLGLALLVQPCRAARERSAVPLDLAVPPNGARVRIPVVDSLDPEVFSAATKHAFVGLPGACARRLGLAPNDGDKGGGNTTWFSRWSQLEGRVDLDRCACSWVIVLHGSGGLTYNNYRYVLRLTALGYAAFAPDDMAYAAALKLRHRDAVPNLAEAVTENGGAATYWSQALVYQSGCSWTNDTPFCFSSDAKFIIADLPGYKEFYQRAYQLRKGELDYLVGNLPSFLRPRGMRKLFLLGQSEGGMTAARYYHPTLEPLLSGRVVGAWTCETNYLVANSTRASGLCEGAAACKATPILNFIGDKDQYFGASGSIAAQVAASDPTLPAPTGSCFPNLLNGHSRGAVALLTGATHDTSLTHDNLERDLMSEFLANPRGIAQGSKAAGAFCEPSKKSTAELAFWTCKEDGDEPLKETKWGELAHLEYHFHGVRKDHFLAWGPADDTSVSRGGR